MGLLVNAPLGRRTVLVLLLAARAGFARAANLVIEAPHFNAEISGAFRRLPDLQFPIEDLTNARRAIYVEPGQGGIVQRAVIVQSEVVQPGSSFRFRYPPRPPQQFGGKTYRFGAYVYDDAAAAARDPSKEAARTRAHLAAHGLEPPRLWRAARLARVADAEGLSELIIFYLENADSLYPPGPLPGADEDGDLDLDANAAAVLLERLRAAVMPQD